MARASVRTVTYNSRGSFKTARSRQLVNKAAALLRKRMGGSTRAPLATRGYYGVYNRRGRDELKFKDDTGVAGVVGVAGGIVLLNGVDQGTDWNQRIGRKFCMKSLLFRIGIFPNTAGSAPGGDVVRVIVFYDLQTNSTAPVPTDVLQNGAYDSPLNLTNRDRFKVIIDKFVTMGANIYTGGNLTTGSPTVKYMNKFKKMNLEVINSGPGGTVGAIQTGGLFLLLMSAFNNTSIADYYTRVRYVDS